MLTVWIYPHRASRQEIFQVQRGTARSAIPAVRTMQIPQYRNRPEGDSKWMESSPVLLSRELAVFRAAWQAGVMGSAGIAAARRTLPPARRHLRDPRSARRGRQRPRRCQKPSSTPAATCFASSADSPLSAIPVLPPSIPDRIRPGRSRRRRADRDGPGTGGRLRPCGHPTSPRPTPSSEEPSYCGLLRRRTTTATAGPCTAWTRS